MPKRSRNSLSVWVRLHRVKSKTSFLFPLPAVVACFSSFCIRLGMARTMVQWQSTCQSVFWQQRVPERFHFVWRYSLACCSQLPPGKLWSSLDRPGSPEWRRLHVQSWQCPGTTLSAKWSHWYVSSCAESGAPTWSCRSQPRISVSAKGQAYRWPW